MISVLYIDRKGNELVYPALNARRVVDEPGTPPAVYVALEGGGQVVFDAGAHAGGKVYVMHRGKTVARWNV